MTSILIEQICIKIAQKLQDSPSTQLDELVDFIQQMIEADSFLKTTLTEYQVQVNQGNATGYQVLVEGGLAYVGEHFHVSDSRVIEAALNKVLEVYLSKPTGIPCNLPLSRVIKFVGRDETLVMLHEKLEQSNTVAITSVCGMGGIGKTELALQYSYSQLSENSYPGGICWLDARGQDIGTGILDFARTQLFLPEPPNTLKTILQQIQWVCRRWRGEPILIVIDDVVNHEEIDSYLQLLDPRFRVIITTRLKIGNAAQQLELNVLTESASLELLGLTMNDADRIYSQLEDAKELCKWLGYLPLGLELVGRYMFRKKDLSIAEMLDRLKAKKLESLALVKASEMTAQRGVAAAFELSWSELPEASRIVSGLLSIFASAPIPWELVEQCLPDWDSEELEDLRDYELLERSLLSRVGKRLYELHPLIREFLRNKFYKFENSDDIIKIFCYIQSSLASTIPYPYLFNIELEKELIKILPHIREVANSFLDYLNEDYICNPFLGLAAFHQAQGNLNLAERWLREGILHCKGRVGKKHKSVASLMKELAFLLWLQGKYNDAEKLSRESLKLLKNVLEEDDLYIADAKDDLAKILTKKEIYSEAENLFAEALNIRKKNLGESHVTVALSVHNIGFNAQMSKQFHKAEVYYLKAIDIHSELDDGKLPLKVQTLSNLSKVYMDLERYSDAEKVLLEAIDLRKNILGNKYVFASRALLYLGKTYSRQGKIDEAILAYQEALDIFSESLGDEHEFTIECKADLLKIIQE